MIKEELIKKSFKRALIFLGASLLFGVIFSFFSMIIFKVFIGVGIIIFICSFIYSIITGDTDY